MLSLVRLLLLRRMLRGKALTLLAFFGITLGAAAFMAIRLLNRSTLQAFRDSIEAVAGKATLTVHGDETGFDERWRDRVRNLDGVASAVPSLQSLVYTAGDGTGILLFGVDALAESGVRNYADEEGEDDPLTFLARPDSVLVTGAFARRERLAVGSPLVLDTPSGERTLVVRGLLKDEGAAKLFGGNLAVMDLPALQKLLGAEGRIDRIDVVPKGRGAPDALRLRVAEALASSGLEVESPEMRSGQVEGMLETFQLILYIFGALSLFVGGFLIYNTVTTAVVRRRREVGILRALGTDRRRIFLLFVAEATVLGLAGGALGGVGGWALARLSMQTMTEAVSQIYLQVRVQKVFLGRSDEIVALAVGTLVSVVSALLPIREAVSVHPVEAMARGAVAREAKHRRLWKRLGWFLAAAAPGFLLVQTRSHTPVWAAAFALGEMLALALLSPGLIAGLSRGVNPVVTSLLGIEATLAARNLARAPLRTSVTVSTFALAVAMTVMVGTMSHSMESSVLRWVRQAIPADLIVSAGAPMAGTQSLKLRHALLSELDRIQGVRGAYSIKLMKVLYQGRLPTLGVIDTPRMFALVPGEGCLEGNQTEARRAQAAGEDAVIVSEVFAHRFGARLGGAVLLPTPVGPRPFRVECIFVDYTSDQGFLTLDRRAYERYWKDPMTDAFDVYLSPGADTSAVRERIQAALGGGRHVFVQTNAEFRGQVRGLLDKAFAITRAMEAVCYAIAMLGIINTLLVAVEERIREIGVFRAIGASRGQLGRTIMTEGGLMGLIASVLGVVLGAALAAAIVKIVPQAIVGWHAGLDYPWFFIASMAGAATGVGALAGWWPARLASRIPVREALEYE